ncbi:hypothetical protein CKJ76_25995 [Mycobacterium avium]|nr:hypothetical protein CKJ76_25995 [Mycobacterium avium]
MTGLRAYWLGQTGDRAAALAAYDKLWPQAVRTLGADDLTTLSILHGYNDIQDWTDSPGSAVAAYERLLTAYTRALGPDHERTAAVAEALERWRVEVADLADTARGIYTGMELRESGRDTLSEDQRRRVDDQVEAFISAEQSDVEGVVDLRTDVDELTRERGPDDPDVLKARRMLAGQKMVVGDIEGGLADYHAVVTDLARVLGPTHVQTFEARREQAFALDHSADGVRARIAVLEELVADQLSALGPHDPITMETRMYLAGSRNDTAELETVLADQVRILGPRHEDVVLTLDPNLAGFSTTVARMGRLRKEPADASGHRT